MEADKDATRHERERKEAVYAAVDAEAHNTAERLEAQGFPGGRVDARCDVHHGPVEDHDIWRELTCWEITTGTEDKTVRLWSDGEITAHMGHSIEELEAILNHLRDMGQ